MKVIQAYLTHNPCFTDGRTMWPRGLMLHSVGCSQPNAYAFVKSWNKPEFGRACVHAFIDGKTGTTYQCLPWTARGWHAGGTANNTHIGVEMCESASLRYSHGATFTCEDREEAVKVATLTYRAAVSLFATLCRTFSLDPLAPGVIISHHEGHTLGIASDHADPEHLWSGLSLPFTMDTFRADVKEEMGKC